MGKPDFFILGAQRAGTTSLALLLIHHPQIAAPKCTQRVVGKPGEGLYILDQDKCYIGKFTGPDEFPMPWSVGAYMKECSYFSRFYHVMSFEDYCSFFQNGNGRLSFEASPEYFNMLGVDVRIQGSCPNAKFIVLLRDPVKRALSHYWHAIQNDDEYLPFEQAIKRSGPCFCNEYWYSYLTRGHYAEHLKRWFLVFPRDRFKIYFMEEFFSDTGYYADLQKWLGLEVEEISGYPHSTTLPNGYWEMDEATREGLRAYYRPHNEALKELLGRELPW